MMKARISLARRLCKSPSLRQSKRSRVHRFCQIGLFPSSAQPVDQAAQCIPLARSFAGFRADIGNVICEAYPERCVPAESQRRYRQRQIFETPSLGVPWPQMRDRARWRSDARDGVAFLPQVEAQGEALHRLFHDRSFRLRQHRHLEVDTYRASFPQASQDRPFDEAETTRLDMQCISDCSDREGLRNERCRRHGNECKRQQPMSIL